MAKYGSPDLALSVDISDGGALTALTQYLKEINGFKVERLTEESHTFGDTWFEALQTGIRKMNDLELVFYYDDTASTIKACFVTSAHTATRSVRIVWGSTNQTDFEAWIVSYEYLPSIGALTRLKVVLRPTGAITES